MAGPYTGFVCSTWSTCGRRALCAITVGHAMASSGQRTSLLPNVSLHCGISKMQFLLTYYKTYPRLDGSNWKDRSMITWLEVVNKDLKELGTCKAEVPDRTWWIQLTCKGLLESCLLEDVW